jgi:hypothetical protein
MRVKLVLIDQELQSLNQFEMDQVYMNPLTLKVKYSIINLIAV